MSVLTVLVAGGLAGIVVGGLVAFYVIPGFCVRYIGVRRERNL